MRLSSQVVRRIRPASLGSAIAELFGLSKRQTVRTAHGNFFLNPVSNFGYQMISGEYEPSMRKVLEKYLAPGQVFVDLGANEGFFSIVAAALVGPSGKVIAVEPQSRLQSVIRQNMSLNSCSNVKVIQGVISAASGSVEIHLTPDLRSG